LLAAAAAATAGCADNKQPREQLPIYSFVNISLLMNATSTPASNTKLFSIMIIVENAAISIFCEQNDL